MPLASFGTVSRRRRNTEHDWNTLNAVTRAHFHYLSSLENRAAPVMSPVARSKHHARHESRSDCRQPSCRCLSARYLSLPPLGALYSSLCRANAAYFTFFTENVSAAEFCFPILNIHMIHGYAGDSGYFPCTLFHETSSSGLYIMALLIYQRYTEEHIDIDNSEDDERRLF